MTPARLWEIAELLRHLYETTLAPSNIVQQARQDLLAFADELEAREKADAETQIDHERLLEHARKVRGSRDVHSVYEVLDWQAKRIAELEATLQQIRRTPTVPFPDAGAHSGRAFSDAVWRAWSRIQQIAAAALNAKEQG